MRTTISILALLAALGLPAPSAAEVGFAVKGGSQTSWAQVEGPLAFDTDAETRFALGVAVPVGLNERVSFEPELVYAEVWFSSRDFDPVARIESRTLLLGLPFKRHWNAAGAIAPHLAAGPQLALIGRTRQVFGGLEEDVSDDVRDMDVALLLGVGAGMRAGSGRATLELRYALGLRNLDETENEIRIRGFQLLLGYRF